MRNVLSPTARKFPLVRLYVISPASDPFPGDELQSPSFDIQTALIKRGDSREVIANEANRGRFVSWCVCVCAGARDEH